MTCPARRRRALHSTGSRSSPRGRSRTRSSRPARASSCARRQALLPLLPLLQRAAWWRTAPASAMPLRSSCSRCRRLEQAALLARVASFISQHVVKDVAFSVASPPMVRNNFCTSIHLHDCGGVALPSFEGLGRHPRPTPLSGWRSRDHRRSSPADLARPVGAQWCHGPPWPTCSVTCSRSRPTAP